VSFFAGTAQPVYVVSYQFSQCVQKGYVYIPATRFNRNTIIHNGIEDWWLRASDRWESVARPLILGRQRTP